MKKPFANLLLLALAACQLTTSSSPGSPGDPLAGNPDPDPPVVNPDPRPDDKRPHVQIAANVDLTAALKQATAWTVYDLAPGATYDVSGGIQILVDGVAIRGQNGTAIHMIKNGSLFSLGGHDLEVSGIFAYSDRKIFDQSGKLYTWTGPDPSLHLDPWTSVPAGPNTPTYRSDAKTGCLFATIYSTASRILLQDIRIRDLDGIVTAASRTTTDLSVINVTADESMRGDLVFFSGARLLVDHAKAVMSWNEHIIRINGDNHLNIFPTDVTIRHSEVDNYWNYPGQTSKEVLAIRDGVRVLIEDNIIRGWSRIGEGNGWDPAFPPVADVTIRNNQLKGFIDGSWFDIKPHTGGTILIDSNQFDAGENFANGAKQSFVGVGSPGKIIFQNNSKIAPAGVTPKVLCRTSGDPLDNYSITNLTVQGLPDSEVWPSPPLHPAISAPPLPALPELPRVSAP